jgi:hypothetical protein
LLHIHDAIAILAIIMIAALKTFLSARSESGYSIRTILREPVFSLIVVFILACEL